jgi:hypothetical protein
MVSFIDAHRDQYGVEPICRQLPIAPCSGPGFPAAGLVGKVLWSLFSPGL